MFVKAVKLAESIEEMEQDLNHALSKIPDSCFVDIKVSGDWAIIIYEEYYEATERGIVDEAIEDAILEKQ